MKKTAILICLIFSLLVSCSKESKGLVIEKAENLLSDAPTAPEGYEYLEGVGSWLEPETEYKPASDEGIDTLFENNFILSGGNLYFQLKKRRLKRTKTEQGTTTHQEKMSTRISAVRQASAIFSAPTRFAHTAHSATVGILV